LKDLREYIRENADWYCKHCGQVFDNFEDAQKHESIDEVDPHHINGEISVLVLWNFLKELEKELREELLPIIERHKNIQFRIVAKNRKERDSLAENQAEWNKLTDKIKEFLGEFEVEKR